MFFNRAIPPLGRLTVQSANELAARFGVAPESQALLRPNMSPGEFVEVLEEKRQSLDAVKVLAHGMNQRDAVDWAAQSAQRVADKLNPEEKAAAAAAGDWVQNPGAATREAAVAAAKKTGYTGPGAWAAQAAAWAQTPVLPNGQAPSAAARGPVVSATPGLTPDAVVAAVLLAAGLTNRPAMEPVRHASLSNGVPAASHDQVTKTAAPPTRAVDQTKLAKALRPFLELGKRIAQGKPASS